MSVEPFIAYAVHKCPVLRTTFIRREAEVVLYLGRRIEVTTPGVFLWVSGSA